MAKALIGYLNSDLRTDRLGVENARLRSRVADLETLVRRLQEENDALVASRAAALLDSPEMAEAALDVVQEMQPA